MGARVVIHAEDHRLTLSDLDPVLDDIEDPVEVHWTGSREDLQLWEKWKHRELVLFVEDQEHAEKALWATGTPLDLSEGDLRAAKKALGSPTGDAWRARVESVGLTRGTLLLTAVIGSSLRSGRFPAASVSIVHDCLFRHVHPADADILLRLRARS